MTVDRIEQSETQGRVPPTSINGTGNGSSMTSIGTLLRERRETVGLSLAEVEKVTRIRQKYLAALEADEWHLLPGEVVARGFLRNYAFYLDLEPEQLMERRRLAVDANLSRSLADTSAGAPLPASREVDYRPKDFDLEETPALSRALEVANTGRIWLGPFLGIVLLVAVLIGGWWGIRQLAGPIDTLVDGLQTQVAVNFTAGRNDPAGVVADNSPVLAGGSLAGEGSTSAASDGEVDSAMPAVVVLPSDTPTATFTPMNTPLPVLIPTDTPVALPTDTATPTETPLPTPTPEPAEEPPPAVVAPVCSDPRASISAPGVNQVISGVVNVEGTATHEEFRDYKLEFAGGSGAEGGYAFFDGGQIAVQGGRLGIFNSAAVPNGTYTIRLTVVDRTGNYPPPCQVTVTVQN